MKKLLFIFSLFLSIGLQAQTVSISCETCQWLKSSDCDVCSSVYKSKMFRGGLKIKKLGKTMYFEHPLSIELVNSKFKMTDANGQKFDFYLNETSFNTIGALKSFIALCACSAPSDTSTIPQITDTDRRLTELAFVGDSLVATVRDINNNIAAVIVLDNAKGTTTPCRDSVWKVVDTIFHKNVFCNIQKVTMASSKASLFFQLTTLADTSLYTTQAQTQCPSPSFAKLDSCNISYLFIYDCSTNSWERFKMGKGISVDTFPIAYVPTETGNTSNLGTFVRSNNTVNLKEINAERVIDNCGTALELSEYKNTEFFVTRKYTKELDNTNVAGISNPAYARQLHRARMGDDHAPFPYPDDAINYSITNSVKDVYLDMSTDTFTSNAGNLINGFNNNVIKNLTIKNKGLIKLINSNLIDLAAFNGNRLDIDIADIIFGNSTFNSAIWAVNPLNPFDYINIKINNIESYGNNSYNSSGLFHAVRNLDYRLNNYKNTNALNLTRVFQLGFGNYKSAVANIELKNVICFKIPTTPSPALTGNSVFYQDIGMDHGTVNYKCSNIYTQGNGLLTGLYLICVNDGYSQGVYDGSILASKINAEFGNITSICNTTNFGTLNFNNPDAFTNKANVFELYTGSSSGSPIIDSTQINISCNNVTTTGGQLIITGTGGVRTISNSNIHIKINKGISKDIVATISSLNLVNSKLIIEGDFEASNKVVSIHSNTIDATSSITLKGKFKTTSPTLEAMEIGNNSGAGVNNIIINGQIITGGGFSIDNPAGTPISVKVMPGCASNVTTSANVTQLGTGIYVDPNFNN